MALTFEEYMASKNFDKMEEQMAKNPYKDAIEPFKIAGNLHYVGDKFVSAHLIDTGAGLILIDTGMPSSEVLIFNSIWQLGFNPKDVKIILHTHGHGDHYGATKAFQQLYGTPTYLGKADIDLYREYPKQFVFLSKDCMFEPDKALLDGDEITIGGTKVKVVASPGHSPGAMSFFFNVEENGRTYRAGLPGGLGSNTLYKKAYQPLHYPDTTPQDFVDSIDRIIDEPVDIWLGSHPSKYHNDTLGKRELMLQNPSGQNPFITEHWIWKNYLTKMRKSFSDIIAIDD
jgi:Zn-dependent hydrolases, including glyoxylases